MASQPSFRARRVSYPKGVRYPSSTLSFTPIRRELQTIAFGSPWKISQGPGLGRMFPVHAKGLTNLRLDAPVERFTRVVRAKVAQLKQQIELSPEKAVEIPIVKWVIDTMFEAATSGLFGEWVEDGLPGLEEGVIRDMAQMGLAEGYTSVAANPAWLTQAAQSSRLKPSRALRNDPAALVTSSQWYRRDPASKRLSHGLTAEFGWQRKPVVIIVPLATLDDDAIQSQAISFQSPPIYISDVLCNSKAPMELQRHYLLPQNSIKIHCSTRLMQSSKWCSASPRSVSGVGDAANVLMLQNLPVMNRNRCLPGSNKDAIAGGERNTHDFATRGEYVGLWLQDTPQVACVPDSAAF
ncbi:cytochrome P450 [Salix suchowensis]|nr:cytochrome P450 [Salix suchowensis]